MFTSYPPPVLVAEPVAGAAVEAHRRLGEQAGLHFVGNVEGHDLVRGKADVIVCEGLLGNVALKLLEGISSGLTDLARAAAEQGLGWRVGRADSSHDIRVQPAPPETHRVQIGGFTKRLEIGSAPGRRSSGLRTRQ